METEGFDQAGFDRRYDLGEWSRSFRASDGTADTFGFIRPQREEGRPRRSDVFAHLDRGRFAVRYRHGYYPLGNQLFDGEVWREIVIPAKRTEVAFRRIPAERAIAQTRSPPTLFWVVTRDTPDLESDTMETDAMIIRARVQYRLPPGAPIAWTQPVGYWQGSIRDIDKLSTLTEVHFLRGRKPRIFFERRDGKVWRPTEDPRLRGRFTFATRAPTLR